jgi:hypothetical protein
LVLEDQTGRDESAVRLEQASEQRRRDVERLVRDDVKGPTREAEVGRVRLHHDSAVTESVAQALRAPRMGLDRDDARVRVEERGRDHAGAGADVEDGGPRGKSRVSDEPTRPRAVELVPAPSPP